MITPMSSMMIWGLVVEPVVPLNEHAIIIEFYIRVYSFIRNYCNNLLFKGLKPHVNTC